MQTEVKSVGPSPAAPAHSSRWGQRVAPASIARRLTFAALAFIFLSAALDKIFHYSQFIAALNSYVVVPGHDGRYLAASVVLAEIIAGAGLLVPASRRAAAALMCAMLVVFAAALAVNVYFGVTAGCGCWFTVTLGRPTYAHVFFDLVLAALAASLLSGPGAMAPGHNTKRKEVKSA